MSKIHRSKSRAKQQIQTTSMSSSYAYTLDTGGGASESYATHNMSDDQEEDDICPVCESECTCPNRSRRMTTTTPTMTTQPSSSPSLTRGSADALFASVDRSDRAKGNGGTATIPSLKIKLTLPPSLQNKLHTPAAATDSLTNGLYKKRSKKVYETTSASESVGGADVSSPFSALGQPLVHGAHLNVDGTVKKKRGRPSKAIVAAREAAKAVGLTSNGSRDGANCQRDSNVHRGVSSARHPQSIKHKRVATTSRGYPPKTQKSRKLAGTAAASQAASVHKKHVRRAPVRVDDDESSELSELQDDGESDSMRSILFPTFISAFSSSNSSSSDDDSDSDHEKQANQSNNDQDKLFKELLGNNNSPPRVLAHRNNWEIRPRKKSVGAEGTTDEETSSDDDDNEADEEEEEEEEADADADINEETAETSQVDSLFRYAGIATGYTDDDEESNLDANLFFSNLSDSSAEDSDDHMGDVEAGFGDDDTQEDDMDVLLDASAYSNFGGMSLPRAAAAGFMAPFEDLERQGVEGLPYELSHGWDSHVLFSNLLKTDSGIFDTNVEAENASDLFNPASGARGLTMEDADTMMATSEEEEAVAMFDNGLSPLEDEDEIVEIFEYSDDGESTEDEFVDIDGISTPRNLVDLRFPASLGSIDPMSIVNTPVMSPGARGRSLADNDNVETSANITSSVIDKPTCKAPSMGFFATDHLPKKSIVISSTGRTANGEPIPSPFPVIRRLRRSSDASGKFFGSGSERGSSKSRPSSLVSAVRSPFESLGSDYFGPASKSPDLPPAEPIKLDEVLNAAFLEAEPDKGEIPGSTTDISCEDSDAETRSKLMQTLRRWDRIPMNTFRKSRAAGGAPELVIPDKMGIGSWPSPVSSRVHRPADGFSYGSAVGSMLRGSPLNAALFNNCGTPPVELPTSGSNRGSQKKRETGKGRASVMVSPVILPVRDGDRTPTNESHQRLGGYALQQNALLHAANIKSRKELRKEKKRKRQFGVGSPASHHLQHHHHHHFPNGKSRSSSSMQRAFSSSVPSLSI